MPHGIADSEWSAAVKEITSILSDRARNYINRETISYSDLYNQIHHLVQSPSLTGPEDHRFHKMLGEVSRNEHKTGRGMLSVLVVHKGGDMMPGPGFFELAQELGYHFVDELTFWSNEFNRVLKAWRQYP